MARSRKPATPSFDVPADVTSASPSGWVFRSEEETGTARPPDVVVAQMPYGDGPLRFAWVPFAIVCSTVLSLFPSKEPVPSRVEGPRRP